MPLLRVLIVVADGAVGPLDEIVQFVLPIAIFAGLWLWSTRSKKAKPPARERPETKNKP
jgi:hypothetical protein